jgi:hypothetical protein
MRRGPAGHVVAVLAVLLAPAAILAIEGLHIEDVFRPYSDPTHIMLLAAGATTLAASLAWAGSAVLGPWTTRSASRSREPLTRTPIA